MSSSTATPCKKCNSTDFGIWTSATTLKRHRYCRNCRRSRAASYAQRKEMNGGSHTMQEWLNELSRHDCCPGCNRAWGQIPPRPDKRYKHVWTKDHIVPVNAGGSDDISNVQPLCYQCNSAKCDGRLTRGGERYTTIRNSPAEVL